MDNFIHMKTQQQPERLRCQETSQLEEETQRRPPPAAGWAPWRRARPRVVMMDVDSTGSLGPAAEFPSLDLLQAHLLQRKQSNDVPRRSIYLLEALSDDFVAILEQHFQLHPALFTDHERLVAFPDRVTGEAGGASFLPSAMHGRDYVSFKYHELLLMRPQPTKFRNLCDVSGRHIAVTRSMSKLSEVGVARRKCTFWSRVKDHGSWDCLIVSDPPIERILTCTKYSDQASYNVRTSPYHDGYFDFMLHTARGNDYCGPPKTSFLDDVSFYLRNYSTLLELTSPKSLSVFVEKIVASHYLKLAEYIQMTIEKVQCNLSRRRDLTSFAVAAVEEQWSDVQALERRIGEYKDDLEAIMLQLCIPFNSPDFSNMADWKEGAADYQFLRIRFREIGERANRLNGSTAALAGLTNNRHAVKAQELALDATERSIREAKSVKALTILGIVFVPLAYVSSLFGMSDPYGPGGRLFWVYFVVAISLTGFIVLGYRTLELWYSHGQVQWSLETAVTVVRRGLKRRKILKK